MKLKLDLIPRTSFYDNVRSNVSDMDWNTIRRKCYEKAKHKCEICGEDGILQGYKHRVECHEIWEFSDHDKLQKLVGFISLCPNCHKVKHFGLTELRGEKELAFKHLMKVNNINRKVATTYVVDCFDEWRERSKVTWSVDIGYIDRYLVDDFNSFMDKLKGL